MKDATGGAGVDVVLDVIGGDYLPRNVAAVAMGGRIIQVGVMAGKPVPFDVGTSLLMKRASVTGLNDAAGPADRGEDRHHPAEFAAQLDPPARRHRSFGRAEAGRAIDSALPARRDRGRPHPMMGENANAGKLVDRRHDQAP